MHEIIAAVKAARPTVASADARGAFIAAPGVTGGVETGAPLTQAERSAIEANIRKLKVVSSAQWQRCMKDKSWDEVVTPLRCYRFVDASVDRKVDPRRNDAHRTAILAVLGIEPRSATLSHLSDDDMEVVRDLFWRKAAAFHHGDGPRTCLTAFKNDTLVSGPPVRGAPIRARGQDAAVMQQMLERELEEGFYLRGASPWGSWAFLTRPTPGGRRRRIVVDYRRINGVIIRAVYYIRRCDDVKSALLGSVYMSGFDGLKGFNLLENTEFSKQVWAVLSEIGCLLPQALQLGGANGPFDFQYVVDETFSLGSRARRRFGQQWLNYLDDFAVRSGRWVRGGPISDAAHQAMLAAARPPEEPARTLGDVYEAAGLQPPDEGVTQPTAGGVGGPSFGGGRNGSNATQRVRRFVIVPIRRSSFCRDRRYPAAAAIAASDGVAAAGVKEKEERRRRSRFQTPRATRRRSSRYRIHSAVGLSRR